MVIARGYDNDSRYEKAAVPMPESVYRPRRPRNSPYYHCVEDHFETFEQVYEDRFERRYGFFRPYVKHVIYRYLDCGDLHNGFARVRCGDCGHEYLLAFSCKRRHFCPSCHQKRVVEFGEWLCREVVKAVPHLHILVSDGCFHANGMFSVSLSVDTKALERIFRHKVLKMLLTKGKITQDMIVLLDKWRHTGFNVFAGQRILPRYETSMENLARYIIRASFSQKRMTYQRQAGRVEYRAKDNSQTKVFDALEWLAAMCSHVPNKGEQMVRYYGYYSNAAGGKRKKAAADDHIPCILEPELTDKAIRKDWAIRDGQSWTKYSYWEKSGILKKYCGMCSLKGECNKIKEEYLTLGIVDKLNPII